MNPPDPHSPDFFARPTLEVAEALLGDWLVYDRPDGPLLRGRIVETEGYTQNDPAFHGWGLYDEETGTLQEEGQGIELFGPPGEAYVYLIYGMHWLLNVVTEPEGTGGAVLIRAARPYLANPAARAFMEERRAAATRASDLTNGPGKLTEAFGITGDEHHGRMLTTSPLYLAPAAAGDEAVEHPVATSARIGITKGTERPWRFFYDGHPFVSPGTPSAQR
ncbi:MAG: 3-methyladenine DNA glycosylase [Bacteroidetes bacterium QS_8_68_28]|nr:MAG: 3-methyladenine DNA glycosylase [Bacteroidetes bacterium QS_8_68_28]